MHTPGTILIAADGTCYRAREPYTNMHGYLVQPFTILYSDGSTGVFSCSGDVPEESSIVWEPSNDALPATPIQDSEDQERISSALALVDDLVQVAGDLGDNALKRTLSNAYHAIERFRIIPSRVEQQLQPSHADGTCGCPDPYCQA